jgi:hypothetical protein
MLSSRTNSLSEGDACRNPSPGAGLWRSPERNSRSKETTCCLTSSTVKMTAVHTSETSVKFCRTTRRHIPYLTSKYRCDVLAWLSVAVEDSSGCATVVSCPPLRDTWQGEEAHFRYAGEHETARAPANCPAKQFAGLVAGIPPRRPGSGHVGFVVDKVALGNVFSEFFGFPCQSSFHQLLHNHPYLSSGVGTIGPVVAAVPSRLSHPTTNNNNKKIRQAIKLRM